MNFYSASNKENLRTAPNLTFLKKMVEQQGFVDEQQLPQFVSQEKLYEYCLDITNELQKEKKQIMNEKISVNQDMFTLNKEQQQNQANYEK